jgi:glycosyltransferase involved in cell wall biosynthesis
MPAYNAGAHLADAIRSVLEQSFTDFELIVVNDGSSDDTVAILSQFASDNRLRVVHNEQNLGLIATLHRGLSECRAPLIARMDADDICDPQRFERQAAFLRDRPDIDIVGGAIRFFGNIPQPNVFQFPNSHEAIHPAMLFFCPLAHPTLMFRRELVEQGLFCYDDEFRHAEDYHLWSRLLLQVRAANLPELVLHYRLHQSQVSSGQANHQYEASLRVRKKMLDEAGIVWTNQDIAIHESVILERPLSRPDYLEELAAWFGKVEDGNQKSAYWDATALHQLLRDKFIEATRRVGVNMHAVARGTNASRYVTPDDADAHQDIPLSLRLRAILRRLRTALR